MKTLLPIVSALIAFLPANPANAAPVRAQTMVTEAVSYADLDMRSAPDRQRLKNRIAFAAYRLCLVDAPASPSPSLADPICYRAALEDALKQMRSAIARAKGPELAQAPSHP